MRGKKSRRKTDENGEIIFGLLEERKMSAYLPVKRVEVLITVDGTVEERMGKAWSTARASFTLSL